MVVAVLAPDSLGVVFGIALGSAVVARAPGVHDVAAMFASLIRAVAPATLPLLLIVALGTVPASLVAEVLIDTLLVLAAWRWIVKPDMPKMLTALRGEGGILSEKRRAVGIVLVILGAAAVIGLTLWWYQRQEIESFESRGGLSSVLLTMAVVLWSVAIVLRLVGFASSVLRALVALFLAAAVGRVAMAVGTLPGHKWMTEHFPWLGPRDLVVYAIVVLLLDVVVEALYARYRHRLTAEQRERGELLVGQPGPEDDVNPDVSGIGLGVALLATAALGAATIVGIVETRNEGGGRAALRDIQLREPTVARSDAIDPQGVELAKRHFPVLAFTNGQRWSPVSVGAYLSRARLEGPPGQPPPVEPPHVKLPESCAGLAPTPCFRLSIRCEELGVRECAPDMPHTNGALHRSGAAYVRLLRRGRLPRDGSGDVFARRGPYATRLQTLIQYWYFYEYDRWTVPLFLGRLVQEHEADWENVTIGLGAGDKPLFAAYSAHCGGNWRPWKDVELAAGEHPLVAVAEGSQANYPKASQNRAPDWTSCTAVPSGTTSVLSYASNIRDKTAYDWLWYPTQLRPVDAETAPMSFPGRWGQKDSTSLTNFIRHELPPGDGPATPSLQPLWQRPVLTIFCGRFEPRRC